jgi:parallel beta-helix repeat protein
MSKGLIVLGAALCVLALAPSVTASQTFVVDDDLAQCPDANFTTNAGIQLAVGAAGPDTTIYVCAGTYTGTVLLAGPAKNDIRLIAKHPAEQVILDGTGTTTEGGFWLQNVSGVLIEGFTVRHFDENILLEGATDSIVRKNITHSAHHDGLHLRNGSSRNLLEENESRDNVGPNGCGLSVLTGSSDNVVIKNEFHGNVFRGIQLVLAGPGNHLKDNLVRNNGVAPAATTFPYPGTGILNLATAGTLIHDNVVRDNAGHGVVLTVGATEVTVRDNFVFRNGSMNDHDGIRLADGASLNLVINNRSEANRHDGLHLLDAHGNVVRDNVIFLNGTNPGPTPPDNGCGIDIENASSNNTVRNNDIEGHDRAGIRLRGSLPSTGPPTMNLVVENDVEENRGYGMLLEDADVNTLRSNDSKKNGNDGLRASAASAGNTFELNDMADNAAVVALAHDCHDDSGAPSPGPPGNAWVENDGKIQNRPGLCKDAAVVPTTHP